MVLDHETSVLAGALFPFASLTSTPSVTTVVPSATAVVEDAFILIGANVALSAINKVGTEALLCVVIAETVAAPATVDFKVTVALPVLSVIVVLDDNVPNVVDQLTGLLAGKALPKASCKVAVIVVVEVPFAANVGVDEIKVTI